MKTSIYIIMIVVLITFFHATSHGEKLNQYEINARDFSFEGISIGMSKSDVTKSHIILDKLTDICDEKINYMAYLHFSNVSSCLACFFLDDKVIEMRILYKLNTIIKLGGVDNFLVKLTLKFGIADNVSGIETIDTKDCNVLLTWDLKNVGRKVLFTMRSNDVRLDVIDTLNTDILIKRRMKTANVGF